MFATANIAEKNQIFSIHWRSRPTRIAYYFWMIPVGEWESNTPERVTQEFFRRQHGRSSAAAQSMASRFPSPGLASDEGLLCVGGKLAPEWLLDAYRHGIFPWPMSYRMEEIPWWSPDPRGATPPKLSSGFLRGRAIGRAKCINFAAVTPRHSTRRSISRLVAALRLPIHSI